MHMKFGISKRILKMILHLDQSAYIEALKMCIILNFFKLMTTCFNRIIITILPKQEIHAEYLPTIYMFVP